MAEKISVTKGLTYTPSFDTYVPELSDNADIQNALEYFYYGNSENGNTIDATNSIYSNLVDFDTRITATDSDITGHVGAISDVHGVGSGNLVVGTGTAQTLTNKTLTSPAITSPTVTGTATLPSTTSIGDVSSTEISYLDGVTSSIQTQINTNTPTGMISIHAGSTAPTGWLICDGASYASASYATLFSVIGYTFGGSGSAFAVPNLKGKIVVGIDGAQTEFDARGEVGGSMTHQHSSSNTGNGGDHSHNTTDHTHNTTDHSHNTADHSHYSDHSHYADHSHYINPGSTATSSDSHSHTTNTNNSFLKVSSGSSSLNVASGQHNHSINSDSHSHTVNIATFLSANANGSGITTGNSNYGNTSGASAGNTTSGASAGNTTSGASDGNITSNQAAHSHTTPTSDAISNLQPYMALNYIIKF